jgi:hypothetical protein
LFAWAQVRQALHTYNTVMCCNYDILCISIGGGY